MRRWAPDAGLRLRPAGPTGRSVGAALKLPCCFERILDGPRVSSGKVSDDDHVLEAAGRHIERLGELPQHRVAVAEMLPRLSLIIG